MPWCVSGRVDRTQYHLLCEGAQPLRLRLEQSCYHFSLFRLQVISESTWQLDAEVDGGGARAVAASPPLSVTSNWAEGKTDSEKRRATWNWLGNRHGCRTGRCHLAFPSQQYPHFVLFYLKNLKTNCRQNCKMVSFLIFAMAHTNTFADFVQGKGIMVLPSLRKFMKFRHLAPFICTCWKCRT